MMSLGRPLSVMSVPKLIPYPYNNLVITLSHPSQIIPVSFPICAAIVATISSVEIIQEFPCRRLGYDWIEGK